MDIINNLLKTSLRLQFSQRRKHDSYDTVRISAQAVRLFPEHVISRNEDVPWPLARCTSQYVICFHETFINDLKIKDLHQQIPNHSGVEGVISHRNCINITIDMLEWSCRTSRPGSENESGGI